MLARVRSAAITGIETYPVEVEVDAGSGDTVIVIVGLPDVAVKKSRDRVSTALINPGFGFRFGRTTINLAPADIKKEGPSFDLPIAIGMVAASDGYRLETLKEYVVVGELALTGGVRSVRGVLPIALLARAEGKRGILVPADNAAEAAVVAGLDVIPVANLREAVGFLEGEVPIPPAVADVEGLFQRPVEDEIDLADVKGQESVKRALEIAAAGGHNVLTYVDTLTKMPQDGSGGGQGSSDHPAESGHSCAHRRSCKGFVNTTPVPHGTPGGWLRPTLCKKRGGCSTLKAQLGNMSLMHRKLCVVSTLIWTLLHFVSAQACTIFVLADAERVLFCNNEDCKNSHTRVWFVPAGKHKLGCGYVGLRNQWAQGGMNTKGLAFDGVAGPTLDGVADASPILVQPKMKRVRGNPSERMLESCGDVEEAIAFYRSHKEPTFSYATIMVADRSGAFAVIGFKSGRLHVVRGKGCGAWGWNGEVASKLISQNSAPFMTNAAMILDKARSQGDYATRYSNIFDLRTGEIALFNFSKTPTATTVSLAEELRKGRHFYDLPQIESQLAKKPRRLSRCKEWMKNLYCWLHLND